MRNKRLWVDYQRYFYNVYREGGKCSFNAYFLRLLFSHLTSASATADAPPLPPGDGALYAPWPGLTPCSALVAHGSVGTGERPNVALLTNGMVAMAVERVAATAPLATGGRNRMNADKNDPLGCGVSAPVSSGEPPLALLGWALAAGF